MNTLFMPVNSTASKAAPPHSKSDSYAEHLIESDASAIPLNKEDLADPRVAAEKFVEHINEARIALGMKQSDLAIQHLQQARMIVDFIKVTALEQYHFTEIEAGRTVSAYGHDSKYHYFPIQTGPSHVTRISSIFKWTGNELAITGVDIVYLTLDLRDDKAERPLSDALLNVKLGDLQSADQHLESLMRNVIAVENKVPVHREKAQQNILLATHFLALKNYGGVRYALKHAEDALDAMQQTDLDEDDEYIINLTEIRAMRHDMSLLQKSLLADDPNVFQKADIQIDQWWNEIRSWYRRGKAA